MAPKLPPETAFWMGHLTLMAPKLPPEAAFWMGHIPTLEELAEENGADAC
eukprot:gene13189-19022_t